MAVVSAWAVGQNLSPEQMRKRTQTLSSAKQIATSAMIYCADYDDMLPIGKSTEQVKKLLMPYSKTMAIWNSENPGSRFLFNTNVTGVSMTVFSQPSRVPMVYESKAWPDGARVIAYVDSHARMEPKEKWPEIERMLKQKWNKPPVKRKGKG